MLSALFRDLISSFNILVPTLLGTAYACTAKVKLLINLDGKMQTKQDKSDRHTNIYAMQDAQEK